MGDHIYTDALVCLLWPRVWEIAMQIPSNEQTLGLVHIIDFRVVVTQSQ